MRRWHLDETVRQVGGMIITDSRGIFDALTRSESQLRLRSSRTGEEARGIKEQCAASLGQHLNDVGRESGSGSRNDGDALLILPSNLAKVGKQEEHLCSM